MTTIRERGDGCKICIDGRIQVDGGNVICDCKLGGSPMTGIQKEIKEALAICFDEINFNSNQRLSTRLKVNNILLHQQELIEQLREEQERNIYYLKECRSRLPKVSGIYKELCKRIEIAESFISKLEVQKEKDGL